MTSDPPAESIPEAWRDPLQVMPHLAIKLAEWDSALVTVLADLGVINGAIEELGPEPVDRRQVLRTLESISGRLAEVERQMLSHAEIYARVSEALRRA